jgi:DNA-3-methyladenine glycosylase I
MSPNSNSIPFPYQEAFAALQHTIRSASTISSEALSKALEPYNFTARVVVTGSDDELYKKLVEVVFYSGMKAATVTAYLSRVHEHFCDFRSVATYTPEQVAAIIADNKMLQHPKKIQACVKNARRFVEILKSHDAIADYFNSFGRFDVDENVVRFRDALIKQFSFLSDITVYHYMMDLGINVAKPDRVLSRVFHRLGLVADPKAERSRREQRLYFWETVQQARAFAATTGESIRRVDISVMAFGQQEIAEFGLAGTCLEATPQCGACQVKPFCTYSPA